MKYFTMRCFHYGKTTKKLVQGISDYFRHFLVIFEALWNPPRASRVPKMENSVPWEVETEHFTMRWFHFGKKCVLLTLKVDKWKTKMIWDMFWPFSSSEGPPKAPWRSPIIPNGQPSVSWKFEKRYFTMRRFHYGNTRWHLYGKWTKDCMMIWGMF